MAYINAYGGGGIPAALKTRMNAVLNKKFGTAKTYEPNEWPDDVNLLGALEEKTTSGAIAHFEDGADGVPLKNWLVTLPASLDGYIEVNGTKNTGTGTPETQYIASLGRTIYGGTADIVTGEGQSTCKMVKLNSFNWSYNDTSYAYGFFDIGANVSDMSDNKNFQATNYINNGNPRSALANGEIGVYNSAGYVKQIVIRDDSCSTLEQFLTKIADYDFVYETTDAPEAFTFEPITPTPETALGVNNFWADEGDSAVTYRSSGTVTPIVPTLISKTITENGTYSAEDDDADGYSEVTVNIPQNTPLIPQFTETKIADNSSHASSFTLSEDYGNYDMVKIVWYESASSSGFLYTTPDILDEIFSVGAGKLCINKPSTNYYVCYTKSGLTWTQTNQRNIYVHEVYGVTFTNCTMTATDLYKRGASTTTRYSITSQTSLKDYDLFMMSSIHNTDGSETMPTTWLYQYPKENMSEAFSCPVPTVLQEYNANDEAFVISEYGMTSARYFMVQGVKFTAVSSSRGLMMASRPVTQLVGEESDPDQVNELVEDDENDIREQLNEVVENDETEQEGEDDA